MPRKVNLPYLKKLAKNPYIFSVVKTLCDEAIAVGWKIRVKEEFNEDNVDYSEKINDVTKFFRNPNGNEESFEHIMRQIITDILELDSGVMVKVFNRMGELKHIFGRDGSTFLKNPDIYGYIGDRAEFVAPLSDAFTGQNISFGGSPSIAQQQMMKTYSILYKDQAAYFQYGWTAGSLPVPFGRREIIYFMQNPRGDSIYGRSGVEILAEIILNLIYGVQFSLDFFTNNNMPEGAIQLIGAQPEHIKQFRENFEQQFKYTDKLGQKRKRFYQFPIYNNEIKFTPFQYKASDIELLAQQQWFTKVLWMCFGVTASEMGFTESVNKATDQSQVKLSKRKALIPLLKVFQYHINTQLMTEFFAKGRELPDYADIPLEFTFDIYDADEDKQKHDILEQEIKMGVKTPTMAAKELDINVDELEEGKEELGPSIFGDLTKEKVSPFGGSPMPPPEEAEEKEEIEKPEEKALPKKPKKAKPEEPKSPLKEIEGYIDEVGDNLLQLVDKIPEHELQ